MKASARLAIFGALPLLGGCEPCAGTVSCHTPAEINYSGHIIERRTGAVVPGVTVRFVRRSGPGVAGDTVRAVSRADGSFELRAQADSDGTVTGDLTIFSPAPLQPYTIPNVEMKTSRVRGDGGILGRMVVDPYLLLVGEVHDRKTLALLVGTKVVMRRTAGALIEPDTVEFITDKDGRFFLQPEIVDFGNGALTAEFALDVPGAERVWRVQQTHKIQFTDGGQRFAFLLAGRTLNYAAQVVRRGSGEPLPGVTVEFSRVSGIPLQPDHFFPPVNSAGGFYLTTEPLADGEAEFELTIRPPAPYPVEVLRGLRMRAHDDDSLRHMGFFGFGAQAFLRAHFVDRATGAAIAAGTQTQIRRAIGVAIETSLAADSAVRAIDTLGTVNYRGATTDSGSITFDIDVRLPAPAQPETFRGLQVTARYDSLPNDVGTFRVGLWIPAQAQILDDAAGTPIGGARVEFHRVSGIEVSPALFATTSQADGIARLAPIPRAAGEVVGNLFVSAGAPYRDTTIANVRLRATQDDTLRSAGVFRLKQVP